VKNRKDITPMYQFYSHTQDASYFFHTFHSLNTNYYVPQHVIN